MELRSGKTTRPRDASYIRRGMSPADMELARPGYELDDEQKGVVRTIYDTTTRIAGDVVKYIASFVKTYLEDGKAGDTFKLVFQSPYSPRTTTYIFMREDWSKLHESSGYRSAFVETLTIHEYVPGRLSYSARGAGLALSLKSNLLTIGGKSYEYVPTGGNAYSEYLESQSYTGHYDYDIDNPHVAVDKWIDWLAATSGAPANTWKAATVPRHVRSKTKRRPTKKRPVQRRR